MRETNIKQDKIKTILEQMKLDNLKTYEISSKEELSAPALKVLRELTRKAATDEEKSVHKSQEGLNGSSKPTSSEIIGQAIQILNKHSMYQLAEILKPEIQVLDVMMHSLILEPTQGVQMII